MLPTTSTNWAAQSVWNCLNIKKTGCQFIDTNNNGEAVLDWLVLYELGVPTGRYAASGHCMYPEVDFYRSERFMCQKEFCDRHFNFVG